MSWEDKARTVLGVESMDVGEIIEASQELREVMRQSREDLQAGGPDADRRAEGVRSRYLFLMWIMVVKQSSLAEKNRPLSKASGKLNDAYKQHSKSYNLWRHDH